MTIRFLKPGNIFFKTMAIDLRKNKDALQKAYNDVVADNNSIDW